MIVIAYRSQMLELLQLASIIARNSKSTILSLDSIDKLDDPVERESCISILRFLKTQSEHKEYVSILAKKIRGKIRLYDVQEIVTPLNEYSKYDCFSIDYLLSTVEY